MITPKTIKIVPTIYMIEVVTHSNNHSIKSFCLNCLSASKTNKQYKEYFNYTCLSSARVCCRCNAMTLSAVITVFDIDKSIVLKLAESGEQYRLKDHTITPTFLIDKIYLRVLKGNKTHG